MPVTKKADHLGVALLPCRVCRGAGVVPMDAPLTGLPVELACPACAEGFALCEHSECVGQYATQETSAGLFCSHHAVLARPRPRCTVTLDNGRHWYRFPSPPAPEFRASMKEQGAQYAGHRGAWFLPTEPARAEVVA